MTAAAKSKRRPERGDEAAVRARILEAAFASFRRKGYAATSTLEIATRAHVSKRDVYALVGAKQEMLIACVSERARRFRAPADLPAPRHRDALARALTSLATQLLREISDPTVVAVFRLAIAEASHAPEVARVLDAVGRETSRAALRNIIAAAQASGLLVERPVDLADQFAGLLWGTLMISLLLGVAEQPGPNEIDARARAATNAFMLLHAPPEGAATPHRGSRGDGAKG
ncbi:MAG: TetR/AcrR family transcriptional regulator [Roseiarcus sp.]